MARPARQCLYIRNQKIKMNQYDAGRKIKNQGNNYIPVLAFR